MKIKRVQQNTPSDPEFLFMCPACGNGHWFKTTGNAPCWQWNGDAERPTITPSILVRYDHWVPPATPENMNPGPQTKVVNICHSFVTDGKIQYLADCTHALAGQTVDLEDFPW